jgi:hypothetical protein
MLSRSPILVECDRTSSPNQQITPFIKPFSSSMTQWWKRAPDTLVFSSKGFTIKELYHCFEMNTKIRAWLLFLTALLVIGAVTGIPHLEQPDLMEPIIALIIFLLINGR